ncbi:MAG: hypothetical protein ACK5JT_10400 [Hyphomicrobiaceae bacterium]
MGAGDRPGLSLLSIGLCIILIGMGGRPVRAQTSSFDQLGRQPPQSLGGHQRAALITPKMIVAQPAAETPFGIRILRPEALPPNSFVRLRGIPFKIALSDGHAIGPGNWAIPLSALASLKLIVPAGVSGQSTITVSLVSVDGGVMSATKVGIVITPGMAPDGEGEVATGGNAGVRLAAPALVPPPRANPPSPETPARRFSPGSASMGQQGVASPPVSGVARPPAPSLPPEVLERAKGFLARGQTFMTRGDISLARQFFERAADMGLAAAAIAMGETFDPSFLAAQGAVGIQPDSSEARHWYEKAATLGAGADARRRIEGLGPR